MFSTQKIRSCLLLLKNRFLKLPMFKLEIFDFFEKNYKENFKLKKVVLFKGYNMARKS